MTSPAPQVDVLIVGSGPAGLAAAIELRRLGVPRVLVVERESEAGGIPRHANHIGFGMRDLHRLFTGPHYAQHYVSHARRAGVELRMLTTVTDWSSDVALRLTSPTGLDTVTAHAIVLATGCRERPRAARLIPGNRPLGVLTTGALQQSVYLHRQSVGRRAVVVGAEHVSFSAVLTLAHGGATTVAMVTEHPRHQTYLPYKWLSTTPRRVPILVSHRITQIIGRHRVEAIEATDTRTGAARWIECDTVIFSGDWIPDHELARRGGLAMDPATRAPRVDCSLRTSIRGVFAAGNLLHAAETADIAALGGRHAARAVTTFLESGRWFARPPLPVVCEPPLYWISPSAIGGADQRPPRDRFTARVREFCDDADLVVRQGTRVLWRHRYRHLVPTLPMHVSADWLGRVDPNGEPITLQLSVA